MISTIAVLRIFGSASSQPSAVTWLPGFSGSSTYRVSSACNGLHPRSNGFTVAKHKLGRKMEPVLPCIFIGIFSSADYLHCVSLLAST